MNIRIFLTIFLIIFIMGCNSPEKDNNDAKTKIMINELGFSLLMGKRVYFAHQSVGNNIIEGLNSLIIKNNDLNFLKIITLEEYLSLKIPENDSSFYLIHSRIGQNELPQSKLDDFQHKLDTLKEIDAAFLKFCYVDINRNTDVNLLYNNYISKISTLEKKHENIKFVYFTIPLTARDNIFKRLIKTILGRPDFSSKRNQFNSKIRGTNNINVFDIAQLESRSQNDRNELTQENLLKEYTYDGGHLNEIGSEKVAQELLIFLSKLFHEK